MKNNLDYLLDEPTLAQVWVELKLTKTNPLHDDYLRYESVEITLAEATKIAHAQCKGIVVEYQGKEYTKTWNGSKLPKLPQGTARLWCSKAWQVMAQRHAKESTIRDEQDHRVSTVIEYLEKVLKRNPAKARQDIYGLDRHAQKAMIDTIYPVAQKALAQGQ